MVSPASEPLFRGASHRSNLEDSGLRTEVHVQEQEYLIAVLRTILSSLSQIGHEEIHSTFPQWRIVKYLSEIRSQRADEYVIHDYIAQLLGS